jgi:hypothetical protein
MTEADQLREIFVMPLFNFRLLGIAVAFALALPFSMQSRQAAAAPGVSLVLAIDVSGSVDSSEYALQRSGYVQAFQNPALQNAILNAELGGIAVTVVQWSGSGQQQQSIGWTTIDSATAANDFADAIAGMTRAFDGSTAVGQAINFSAGLMATAPEALRYVIDVSGDGEDNVNGNAFTEAARDAAVASGITINGLPIAGGASLLAFYTDSVIGGPGAFVLQAGTFDDFAGAVQQKLIREITGVPAPAGIAVFGIALAGLGMVRLRRS